MKKNLKYLVFLMPLIFLSSVNYSVKANNKKNTVDKVTVVELEDQDLPSYSFKKIRSREITIEKIPSLNQSRNYINNRNKPGISVKADDNFIPSNVGRNKDFPHTTSLVQSDSRPKKATAKESITSSKPYIAVGRIYSVTNNIGTVCSGALIGKAVVATSAECVAEFGGAVADTVWFTPAATSSLELGAGPLGMWKAKKLYIPACFTAGDCRTNKGGIYRENNIALFSLKKKNGRTPFDMGGTYLNYGWNDPSFFMSRYFRDLTQYVAIISQITTLGYPSGIGDKSGNTGGAMIKTDSFVQKLSSRGSNGNVVDVYMWGSGQPGASGSPAIVNFGFKPFYSNSSYKGKFTTPNIVVGIQFSSKTKIAQNLHVALGSIFGQNISYPKNYYLDKSGRNWGAGNIGFLMRKVCGQGYGKGQSDGICLKR